MNVLVLSLTAEFRTVNRTSRFMETALETDSVSKLLLIRKQSEASR